MCYTFFGFKTKYEKHTFWLAFILYNLKTKWTSIAPFFLCKNGFTLTRCRSMGFIIVPWKNSTVVKCRLNSPSNSKSGGFLIVFTTELYRMDFCGTFCIYRIFFVFDFWPFLCRFCVFGCKKCGFDRVIDSVESFRRWSGMFFFLHFVCFNWVEMSRAVEFVCV